MHHVLVKNTESIPAIADLCRESIEPPVHMLESLVYLFELLMDFPEFFRDSAELPSHKPHGLGEFGFRNRRAVIRNKIVHV